MASSTRTLSFLLTNRYSRLFFQQNNITFMYDSGAGIPVWCTGVELFETSYPDARKTDISCTVTGFGKGEEIGSVYHIPRFVLSEESSEFVIHNLYVAVLLKPSIGCDFVISETMLSKTDTQIIRRGKKELQIVMDDKELYCTAKKLNGTLFDIAVWSQAE